LAVVECGDTIDPYGGAIDPYPNERW